MEDSVRYRELAAEARKLALATSTRQTVEGLLQMAVEYDRKADAAEKRGSAGAFARKLA